MFSYSLGNNVSFTSKPLIRRSFNETIVIGCTYTSARNIDLIDYAFIEFNNSFYNFDRSESIRNSSTGYEFYLPNYVFPYYIHSGDFACGFKIGEERFPSNYSALYQKPGLS